MTKRQAASIGTMLGKASKRLIQFRNDETSWGVIVACNEHDSATKGCLVISDSTIKHIVGVAVMEYDPHVLYDHELSVAINYDDLSAADDLQET
jgi:hypothetical protein